MLNKKTRSEHRIGEDDEENYHVGNGISDDACIYGRMLGRVG